MMRANGFTRNRATSRAACPTQRPLEDGEPRFAHAVSGRPDGVARRSLETAALEVAGDDANHARPVSPLPIADCGLAIADWKWKVARTIRNPKSAIGNG